MKRRRPKVMNCLNILYLFFICSACVPHTSQGVDREERKRITTNSVESTPVPGAFNLDQYLPLIADRHIACVVNQTSIIGQTHLVDTLRSLAVQIVKIFAPEHGFRGGEDNGALIENALDQKTGLPVISLYGQKRKPSQEDLKDIDIVLFDIQDVGVRFYTYISTLQLVMEACAEQDIPVVVLDRPNPNGYYVDGPVLKEGYRSFIGMQPVPVVYGMTIGEYARMLNGEKWLSGGVTCDLTVVPCTQYDHTMTYELPVPPSPNLPNLRAVLLYPSLCFFEGTEVSVGRGTDKQFQIIGHPDYPHGYMTFVPEPGPGATHPKLEGVLLHGDDLTNLSDEQIVAWKQLHLEWLLKYFSALAPKGRFFPASADFFDKLAGSDALRLALQDGWTENEIRGSWQDDLRQFMAVRKRYLLYPDFN